MDARAVRPTAGTRTVWLPDGRAVAVRPAREDDVPGIVALFEALSPEDRHRRFFSGFQPDEGFVSELVGRPTAKGRLLVAELSTSTGRGIVAEAEYALLAEGDAELAMTVDRRWRGWLAAFLLDALLEDAAASGISSLRAEVLAQNRPMLALLRSRGCAVAETGDPCVSALVVGSDGTVPPWAPGAPHPRVVLEATGGRWRLTAALRAAGIPLLRCSGPANRPARAPCPLLEGGTCPLADGADVVVHALDDDDPRCAAVLDAHRGAGRTVVAVTDEDGVVDVDAVLRRVVAVPDASDPGG